MAVNRFLVKTNKKGIITIFTVVIMLLSFCASCSKEKREIVKLKFDPEKSFTVRTENVSMLISDSGITRYRLVSKLWLIFDKAKEPYWFFPKGLYVEKYDTLFHTEGFIKADTAYNYSRKHLWKLVGNVKIVSLQGSKFETSLLYWDQREAKLYSDKFMKIQEADKIITGIGFESNQEMTDYRIFNSTGEFPVSTSPSDSAKEISIPDSVLIGTRRFN